MYREVLPAHSVLSHLFKIAITELITAPGSSASCNLKSGKPALSTAYNVGSLFNNTDCLYGYQDI